MSRSKDAKHLFRLAWFFGLGLLAVLPPWTQRPLVEGNVSASQKD